MQASGVIHTEHRTACADCRRQALSLEDETREDFTARMTAFGWRQGDDGQWRCACRAAVDLPLDQQPQDIG